MAENENFLIYDGDCPFCSNFVKLTRLRETVGTIRIVNARDASSQLDEALSAGFVIDEGMLLKIDDQYYHGADCMNRIALLTSRSGFINKTILFIFRSHRLSQILYPILRFFRNTTIKLLGVSRLGY